MTTLPTITVPVTGIPDIECHGSATLTPAQVSIRYERRQQPRVTVSGPTRYGADEPCEGTFDFSGCTCRKWLADLVERHRPAGYRSWEHAECDAWRIVDGRYINVDDAPDPHRDLVAALKAALDDSGECEVMRCTLTQALAAAAASVPEG
ncbi:hypothetical protein PH213_20420 [Streptomyces sp. SRF1]|uniref:hypothetical protein n=1 Tax=Streptomyces sp. SRF1 TaxID=1549642 RepID=UPI0025B18415|nr:hypothetical protein [Streptomyces sp. SRF1]MDN3056872.1 hypothetical protein [Streptomyces sp. SRF1]